MSPIAIGPASGPEVDLKVTETSKPSEIAKPRSSHEEHQYLDLIRDILDNGEHRPDRYVNVVYHLPSDIRLTLSGLALARSQSSLHLSFDSPSLNHPLSPPNRQPSFYRF